MITPFHKRSDFPEALTLDNKIQIFYERVTGWQLDIADMVINGVKINNGTIIIVQIVGSGYATLDILMSYFEMIAKYRDGSCKIGGARKYFAEGLKMVFPELCKQYPWIPEKMYYNVRCGLYHHGLTESDIMLLGEGFPPISPTEEGERLIVNPHTLVLELKKHFETYVKQLKDDKNLRSNFEKRFDWNCDSKKEQKD